MCTMCLYCGAEVTQPKIENKEHDALKPLQSVTGQPLWACKNCAEKKDRQTIKQGNVISPMNSLSSSDSSVSNCSEFSVEVSSYDRGNQEESRVNTNNERLWESASANPCNSFSETEYSNALEGEMDDSIWEPPEPDDPEDDVEGCMAFNDDDDEECGDGMKWGKPSSLSHYKDVGSSSYRFKEEKQNAMEAVRNGKFKTLVCQLLVSVGVVGSSVDDGQSWVDIITSLSWEAASFLKPDSVAGKTMDPDGYVKVKCIATGAHSESQLVKGLVFKKHAAHKHMPIKYKNPRLLLIQGVLGQSSSGLSSFNSMEQEKDYLKSVIDTLELCHPNVVLVEKTVSRDIQESIVAKKMTLVFDMKLHRLERIARCTGSPILSSDTMLSQKLKQCESFHIEKFIEEHAGLGGGKTPSKTLMFIEGCPTHLGCTILLKGAQSDILKKIKCVVQCAVILAYHLILETCFLVDQRAIFSTPPFFGVGKNLPTEVACEFSTGNESLNLGFDNSRVLDQLESSGETGSDAIDIPISDGFHGEGSNNTNSELQGSSTLYEPYNPIIFSGFSSLSASLKKVIGASPSYQSLSSYLSLNGRELNNQITNSISISTSPEAIDQCDVDDRGSSDEERSLSGGQTESSFTCAEASVEMKKDGGNNIDQMQSKNEICRVLDSQSILVLMSTKNAFRETVCEQSHFSHIMFYKNFDIPIGKFLQDTLLNQRNNCPVCGELPEAHIYCYAHRNKQLTIRVKRLSIEHLPGEAEGKLWMWSRCGKCKPRKGNSNRTKRVLISSAARSLSFGNFLELNFSNHSLTNLFSSCGHSLRSDFLYFFGLGPMVAMFKYSPVTTYTVCVPPLKLPLSNSNIPECCKKEIENVLMKGYTLLSEVRISLEKIRSQFDGLTLKLKGSLREFSDIEEMLSQEESNLEANIHNAVSKNRNSDQAAYKLLGLNRVHLELLLQSCIWDQRLHSLVSPTPTMIHSRVVQELNLDTRGTTGENVTERIMREGEKCSDGSSSLNVELDTAAEVEEFPIREIPIKGPVEESKERNHFNVSTMGESLETLNVDGSKVKRLASQKSILRPNGPIDGQSANDLEENFTLPGQQKVDATIFISRENGNSSSIGDLNLSSMEATSPHSLLSSENSSDWFWASFSEFQQLSMKDLQRVLPKFEPMSGYTSEYLPTAHQLITEEGQMLHIPVGTDNHIVRDYDGELSSVIACALAYLKDPPLQTDDLVDGESGIAARTLESFQSLVRVSTNALPYQTSNGSSDSDSIHSMASISFDESRFSSFDGLNLLDSLVPPGTHPMVTLRVGKSPGRDKYTVLCPYANQFRDLRSHCCESEVDFIASLSRCKNWDAKGGKSKAFFAKTVDERLIIKEIKKTEFDSFVKFAEDYFNHMNQSFEKGNQTCLAKVLGIYQVVVKQTKTGKEMKHDLMVMENLTFGWDCTRLYDLKGALHDRFNSSPDGPGDVLLDGNFVKDMNSSPFYVSNKAKQTLQRALWNDTTFLNSINVMDYSLFVAMDTKRQELVCGIIDYLRQYTWDKHLENWVKSSLVPKNVLPTVISPIEYKRRLRKFVSKNLWSVPDHWCSSESSDPHHCQQCLVRRNSDASEQNPEGKEG